MPMFSFPKEVKKSHVRMMGCQVAALCGASILMKDQAAGKYIPAFLMFDYTSRLFFGGKVSLLGNSAAALGPVVFDPKETEPGNPKQFATLCGVMFSTMATAAHFSGNTDAGAMVAGALMCAAGMEGLFDFCLGCQFYGMAVKMGLI